VYAGVIQGTLNDEYVIEGPSMIPVEFATCKLRRGREK